MFIQYTRADFLAIKRYALEGLTIAETVRRTGISRGTVRNWRRRTTPPMGCRQWAFPGWRPPDPLAYCYLLGLYLGDGTLTHPPRGFARLQLIMDGLYSGILTTAAAAMQATAPGARVCHNPRPRDRGVLLLASSPAWPHAFPQDGPGRKHKRKIELEEWQRELTTQHPRQLLRGLIHSDGARVINRFRVNLPSGRVGEYAYPRYFFSNMSADIRGIFCEHCELLGVRWTQSNHRNISVSHRDSVAILDSFIGPKR